MFDFTKPQIMGILNVTQDSFSDGGCYFDLNHAKSHALEMIKQGADIIDIGGESTRPGAAPISLDDELNRVIPVIEYVASLNVPISIDTNKPEVMTAAVASGASMINDVYALQKEGALHAASKLAVPICIMHMQGTPKTMQMEPEYNDIMADIIAFFEQRIKACESFGISKDRLIIDPGFGFGKTTAHNFSILKHLSEFKTLGLPILAGLSRKSMIAAIIDKPAEQRGSASVALAMLAYQAGANILRVHDVAETYDALQMFKAVEQKPVEQGIAKR